MKRLWSCDECSPVGPCLVEVEAEDDPPKYCLYMKGVEAVFTFVAQDERADQSDKEMFDAQMISNLKEQIADMHKAMLQNSDGMHYLRERIKELEQLLIDIDRKMMAPEGIDLFKSYWHETINSFLRIVEEKPE